MLIFLAKTSIVTTAKPALVTTSIKLVKPALLTTSIKLQLAYLNILFGDNHVQNSGNCKKEG
jgi:hypothetical protein